MAGTRDSGKGVANQASMRYPVSNCIPVLPLDRQSKLPFLAREESDEACL
jgi:hypothetical protein